MDIGTNAAVSVWLKPKLLALRTAFLSLNSGAQAKTALQLYHGATPRHPLMEPLFVPLALTIYIGFKPHFALLCRRLGTTGKSIPFRLFALIHNILLCGYSLWTTTNVWTLTATHWQQHGMDGVYCTKGLWDAGMQYWGFLFYLSKYWELMDTVLLVIKQRSPSFLQVYHHAVTIVCAYMLQASHASMTYLFVGLNSTVHTIMYAYYALTVLKVRLGIKPMITIMQIVQFIVGSCMALPMFFMRGGTCAVQAQKIGVGALILHALILIKLFVDFYRATYVGKKKSA